MKRKVTTILAMLLCAILTVTSICTDTAYAADNTVPLKIGFKGKTITFSDDATERIKEVNLKTMKKKWGKPKVEKHDDYTTYTWKKGKTTIYYMEDSFQFTNIHMDTTDKNATLCGMKVGMKQNKAKKIMKKLGAESYKSGMSATLPSGTMISCSFKNGKVSSLYCTAYVGETSE